VAPKPRPASYFIFPWVVVAIFTVALAVAALGGILRSSGPAIPMAGPGSVAAIVRQNLTSNRPMSITQRGEAVTLQVGGKTYHATFDERLNIVRFLGSTGVAVRGSRFRRNVTIKYESPGSAPQWVTVLLDLLPPLVFLILLIVILRSGRGFGRRQ
jgi:hypothetical protein